jgi:hypothetical protein
MQIKCLLPALIQNEEQEDMTSQCKKSLQETFAMAHQRHGAQVHTQVDGEYYANRVAACWNVFLDQFRGKKYDFLLITANDMLAAPYALDYMLRAMEDYPDAGMVTGKIERNLKSFVANMARQKYTRQLTPDTIEKRIDPAAFLLRKGVIETVGRVDEWFPIEYVERDYMRRMHLAGFDCIQPDVVTWYHPSHSGTVGNDMQRFDAATKRYIMKWGGDPETFQFPFQDPNLDFTFCKI